MSAIASVARKDVAVTCRSKMAWGAAGVLIVFVLANWAAGARTIESDARPYLLVLAQLANWLPLIAIVLGYNAVVGERESGRIRVLLGQPGTRRDVVFGTFLARAVVLLAALAVTVTALLTLLVVRVGPVAGTELVAGALAAFLYGLAWLGMTVGISALASNGKEAVGAILVVYVLTIPLWPSFTARLLALAATGEPNPGAALEASELLTYADGASWFPYAYRLSPPEAFVGALFYLEDLARVLLGGTTSAPHGPNLFGVAVLLAWAAVPLAVGYRAFRRADLQ